MEGAARYSLLSYLLVINFYSHNAYEIQITKLTKRAVVGEPFTFNIVMWDTGPFSETLNVVNTSPTSPSVRGMCSIPFTHPSRPPCRNYRGFVCTCVYTASQFRLEINVTKTAVDMYSRRTWNFQFTKKGYYVDNDIGVIYPFELSLRFKTIRESAPAEISCVATPKTTPTNLTIYWMRQYWGHQYIQERRSNRVKSNLTLDLHLNPASYQDGGRYVCAASSGEEASDGSVNHTVTEQVPVQAAPRADHAHTTVFARQGASAVLTATFLNTSDVTVHWSRDGHAITDQHPGLETQARVYRVYGKNVTSRGILSRLHVKVDDDTHGLYDVTACSQGGCAATTIRLTGEPRIEPPSAPVNFRIAAPLPTGALLSWESGLNDSRNSGQQYMFYVTFRMSGDVSWNFRPVKSVCPRLPVYYLLSDLRTGTGYDVRVQSVATVDGKVYNSPFTEELHIQFQASQDLPKGVGIGLATGVFLAMLGTLIVLGLKRARKRQRPVKRTEERSDVRKMDDVVVDHKDAARRYGNMPASRKGGIPRATPPLPPGKGTKPNKLYDALKDNPEEMYDGLEMYEN